MNLTGKGFPLFPNNKINTNCLMRGTAGKTIFLNIMRKVILTTMAIAAMATGALAQGLSGFQLHAGLAFPTGNFGSDSKNKGPESGHGHAAMGFNLGFKYYAPLASANGLSLVFGLDGFYNGLQSEYTEDLIEVVEDNGGEITIPKYINIPLTGGVNYAHALNDNLSLYGELGLGVNYSMITNSVVEYEDFDFDSKTTTSYKSALGFTYGLEAGILISKKFTIGLRYSGLGSYKYKGTTTLEVAGDEDEEDFKFNKKLPINNFSIVLGIKF
jgi:opacity protein-like surface antigen